MRAWCEESKDVTELEELVTEGMYKMREGYSQE